MEWPSQKHGGVRVDWLTGRFGVSYQTGLSCFAGFAWAMWKKRNKMCIQKTFLDKPLDIIHPTLSFVQKWTILMKTLEKAQVEKMAKMVLKYTKGFKPLDSNLSDVGFM